jgi:peptide/nickel transport system substrate-binding protein
MNTGQFDLDIEVPNQNDANPAFLLALRWYSRSNVKSAAFIAAGPRFDALIEQALAAETREEVQQKAAEAMHLLVDEDVVAIPLAGIYRIYAMKDHVHGFEPHPSRLNQWWNTVWLAR